MKDWKELTKQELADLTDEQIEQYERLICAQEGIKMLERPVEPTSTVDESKDLEIFRVSGFGSYLCFTDINEAQATVEFLKKLTTIGLTNYFADRKYFELGPEKHYSSNKPVDITISSEVVYTKDRVIKVENAFKDYKEAKKQYDDDLKEYNETVEARETAIKEFRDTYYEACTTIENRRKLCRIYYNDYLPLAEGNREMAMSFLKKAYSVTAEDELYINSQTNENGSTGNC